MKRYLTVEWGEGCCTNQKEIKTEDNFMWVAEVSFTLLPYSFSHAE